MGVPTKVELAAQADAYTLVLGLRGIDGNVALHVSWHPDAARVCLGPPPPRIHKTEQLSFGEQCHALLRNLVLTRAALPEPWERVATFPFRRSARRRTAVHAALRGRDATATPCWWTMPRGRSPRAPTRWEPRKRPCDRCRRGLSTDRHRPRRA